MADNITLKLDAENAQAKPAETAAAVDLVLEGDPESALIQAGAGFAGTDIRTEESNFSEEEIEANLKAGIPYVTLGGAVPNPHLQLVYEGIDLCKKEGVDFLLASTAPAGKSRCPGPYDPGFF